MYYCCTTFRLRLSQFTLFLSVVFFWIYNFFRLVIVTYCLPTFSFPLFSFVSLIPIFYFICKKQGWGLALLLARLLACLPFCTAVGPGFESRLRGTLRWANRRGPPYCSMCKPRKCHTKIIYKNRNKRLRNNNNLHVSIFYMYQFL